jgi:5-hydroxyisourate hydrolase
MSQITSHILDTSKGKPVPGVVTILLGEENEQWTEIVRGITDGDGRVSDFLNKDHVLPFGNYKMRFETRPYFDKHRSTSFFPYVEIVFSVMSDEHFHIPLLLSPFGYTTYRGS